jgi:hypothetical protein
MRRHGNRDCLTRALPKAAYQQKGGALQCVSALNDLHRDLYTGTAKGQLIGSPPIIGLARFL